MKRGLFVMTYSEKLKDPRWQRKRLEVMQDADFSCERCGSTTRTLNVHHKKYRKGRNPWEYQRFELECLCEDCHKGEHFPARPCVDPAQRAESYLLSIAATRNAPAMDEFDTAPISPEGRQILLEWPPPGPLTAWMQEEARSGCDYTLRWLWKHKSNVDPTWPDGCCGVCGVSPCLSLRKCIEFDPMFDTL